MTSTIRPLTPQELALVPWPPSLPANTWLYRTLLAPWQRWDVSYYLAIVTRGYSIGDGTTQFHPLYPLLAIPLAHLGIPPLLSLLFVSSAASLLLYLAFARLAALDLPPSEARLSVLLLALAPPAFILFAPYTEALFLLWAVLCLWYARRRQWWQAGLAGALATLTRQQGIFLLLPLAWELWEATGRDWRKATANRRGWVALALPPLALLSWLAYRSIVLADVRPQTGSLQELVYSVLISPAANKVVPVQDFLWPWQALSMAFLKMVAAPDFDFGVDLVLGLLFLALLIVAWRHMTISYRIYSLTMTWLAFSYYTGPYYPYMGLPRHLLLAFPVFIGLVPAVHKRYLGLLLAGTSLLGYLFLSLLYVVQGWVP